MIQFWRSIGEANDSFKPLSKLAMSIALTPHSNAIAERVFSLIGNQLTSSRKKMIKETTLNNIMIVRCAELSDDFVPSESLMKAAKRATQLSLL